MTDIMEKQIGFVIVTIAMKMVFETDIVLDLESVKGVLHFHAMLLVKLFSTHWKKLKKQLRKTSGLPYNLKGGFKND